MPTGPPLVVTGLPRSGTSWVGKMLEASGQVVYVNEPLNPRHPPGGSPGVLGAAVRHRYQYVTDDNEGEWLPAFQRLAALRYDVAAELRVNRSGYDLARMAKYLTAFTKGRMAGHRALLDDPYALFSVPWLSRRLGAASVIVVRDPAGYVGSRHRVGWATAFDDLLDQDLLRRDLLGDHVQALEQADGVEDPIERAAVLWAVAHDVVDRHLRDVEGVVVVRYEDLATEPVDSFRALYEATGLTWNDRAEAAIVEATTDDRDRGGGFQWSLRGLSKTAFRPMDSAATLDSYRDRLSPDQVATIRRVTDEVAVRFPRTTGQRAS